MPTAEEIATTITPEALPVYQMTHDVTMVPKASLGLVDEAMVKMVRPPTSECSARLRDKFFDPPEIVREMVEGEELAARVGETGSMRLGSAAKRSSPRTRRHRRDRDPGAGPGHVKVLFRLNEAPKRAWARPSCPLGGQGEEGREGRQGGDGGGPNNYQGARARRGKKKQLAS